MIRYLQEFLSVSELLKGLNIDIDFTKSDDTSYGVSQTGSDIVKIFLDGATQNQDNFIFFFRDFSSDEMSRLKNNNFATEFQNWIREQDRLRAYPIKDKHTILSIKASNSLLFDTDKDGKTSLYQIQIQINYIKEI